VERAVDKKIGRMREDMAGLHRKVEELEGALYSARQSTDVLGGTKGKGKYVTRNGIPPTPEPPSSYTFPPVDPPHEDPKSHEKSLLPAGGMNQIAKAATPKVLKEPPLLPHLITTGGCPFHPVVTNPRVLSQRSHRTLVVLKFNLEVHQRLHRLVLLESRHRLQQA